MPEEPVGRAGGGGQLAAELRQGQCLLDGYDELHGRQ